MSETLFPMDDTAHHGQIVAVASGKGGVGKTWFSITLSHALAKLGKRVLLFDGDLGMANVDIQLGLMPEVDLADVISGQKNLKDVIYHYTDKSEKVSFDIIPGRSGSTSLTQMPMSKVMALRADLAVLSKDYDYVLIDLGAGVDPSIRHFVAEADHGFIVSTQEPTSMTDAYAFIKLLKKEAPEKDIHLVVNQALTLKDGNDVYASLRKVSEKFLQTTFDLMGIIRFDKKVPESIRYQSPILTRHPNVRPANDVESVAKKLIKLNKKTS